MKAEVEEGNVDNEYQTIRNSMKYHFPSAIITGRGAAVYSWKINLQVPQQFIISLLQEMRTTFK